MFIDTIDMAPYLARPYGSYITLSTTVFLSFSSVMATPTPIADATALISNIDPFFPHLSLMPSHVAHLLSTCTYIAIGSLSVFIWDILCHIRDDYHIVSKHRVTLPTFVYFLSRLSTLLWLLGNTINQTIPLGHCNTAIRLVNYPFIIALPASQFLFFLHVRAIYATERIVVRFFTLLWLCTVVSAVAAVATISGSNIGPTNYCILTTHARISIGTVIILLVNDILLFIALVARIMGTSTENADTCQLKDRFKMVLFGASIPRLAKTLLQNGRQYFLVTVVINLASVVVYFADGENPTLGFTSIMLMNLMASRLYRKTKLTSYDTGDVSFQLSYGLHASHRISFLRNNPMAENLSNAVNSPSGSMDISASEHGAKKSSLSGTPVRDHESNV